MRDDMTELLRDCPAEALEDHQEIAEAIRNGALLSDIMDMPATNRWPETYAWLKGELTAA